MAFVSQKMEEIVDFETFVMEGMSVFPLFHERLVSSQIVAMVVGVVLTILPAAEVQMTYRRDRLEGYPHHHQTHHLEVLPWMPS
jgi:hypothetical protein